MREMDLWMREAGSQLAAAALLGKRTQLLAFARWEDQQQAET